VVVIAAGGDRMARRLELDELVEYGWDITVTATSGPFY
jgi:hypothetical protein